MKVVIKSKDCILLQVVKPLNFQKSSNKVKRLYFTTKSSKVGFKS